MKLTGHNVNGGAGHANPRVSPFHARRCRQAFTLIEMMVVIGIIALLTAIGLPALQNLTKSKGMSVVQREMRDVFAYARQLALTSRSTVYVVFNPTNVWNLDTNRWSGILASTPPQAYDKDYQLLNTLVGGQLSSYAIYAKRTIGAQPGTENPYYLADWRSFPEGVFIPPGEFENTNIFQWDSIRFPTSSSTNLLNQGATYPGNLNQVTAPYIAFNPRGQITLGRDIWLPFTEGSFIKPLNADKSFLHVNAFQSFIETKLPVTSGNIRPGARYYVRTILGTTVGEITYDGVSYTEGETFEGISGQSAFTVVTPNTRVFEFEGVRLNWLTGRAEIVRPELGQQP